MHKRALQSWAALHPCSWCWFPIPTLLQTVLRMNLRRGSVLMASRPSRAHVVVSSSSLHLRSLREFLVSSVARQIHEICPKHLFRAAGSLVALANSRNLSKCLLGVGFFACSAKPRNRSLANGRVQLLNKVKESFHMPLWSVDVSRQIQNVVALNLARWK